MTSAVSIIGSFYSKNPQERTSKEQGQKNREGKRLKNLRVMKIT